MKLIMLKLVLLLVISITGCSKETPPPQTITEYGYRITTTMDTGNIEYQLTLY